MKDDDDMGKNALFSISILMLGPIYFLLSVAAILSRNSFLLKSLASHGKNRQMSPHGGSEFLIPKRYFSHFYIVGLLSASGLFYCDHFMSSSRWLLFSHLSRRAYECWYIHRFRHQSKMHLAGYLLGIGHYGILPLVFVGRTPGSAPFSIDFLCCMGNIWMQYEQHMHHKILADLRPLDSAPKDQHATYELPPKQRWFRWSLSPHYLAEILLYASWAVMLTFQPARPLEMSLLNRWPLAPSLLRTLELFSTQRHWFLFFWVMINLSVSSLNNRDWYHQKFPELFRAALLPWRWAS